MIKGIDCASYQSTAYSTSGLAFVFVKATEGTTYFNPKYADQVAHGRASGLTVGHYLFQRPGGVKAQADYFAAHAAVKPGDMVAVDWEDSDVTCAAKDSLIKALQAKYPKSRVVLYCNLNFWLHRDTTSFCGDGLWIADPNSPAGHPNIKHPWTFHQYGISGADLDVANFATKAALNAWADKGVVTPPKTTITPKEPIVATQIVDIPQTGDIGTVDENTPSGRKEYGAGYYFAHLLDESRKTNALLQQVVDALKSA
ncbi:MAG TPA: glycoside hydrolase family 25 protein [Dehalococcoidia bacterium]|nr:glycoside hydrolase family 25 protein [Dehalococcoidia bacterium]